jgi:chemotaxis protein methyltransferase CheR/two-component system chemotaxis response regulator CheB
MTDALALRDYQRLADLIEGQVGIRLPASKRAMVEGRLRRRVRALQLPDLEAYCRMLFDGGGLAAEMVPLIDAVTTNKTDFFREPQHFDFLKREAVPALLAERTSRQLKVVSAACSNGAEPYTLAMVLAEMALKLAFRFAILGLDISTQMLAQAEAAVYPAAMMDPVPPELRARWVMRSRDPAQELVRMVPELRRAVRFMRLNLMDGSYALDRDIDVIFCRNVLIYFDAANQRAVIQRLAGHLRTGGFLFVGHSDCICGDEHPALKPVSVTVFQKR